MSNPIGLRKGREMVPSVKDMKRVSLRTHPVASARSVARWSGRTLAWASEPLTRPLAAMVVSAQSEAFRRTFGSVGSPGPWRS